MPRQAFVFADIERECLVDTGCYALHGWSNPKRLGAKVIVPPELMAHYPYNASAYAFLQELRSAIFDLGTIEFPGLPVNPCNYTLAQGAPKQHAYSRNPYLTGEYQHLHQDTPPYPTAFWLGAERRYFGTWVVAQPGLQRFMAHAATNPQWPLAQTHRVLVPESLAQGTGIILNRHPGLLLIDNSQHQQLYHARTCDVAAISANPTYATDAPMYAFNEQGLLHYIDTLDERRGSGHRDEVDKADMEAFLAWEKALR